MIISVFNIFSMTIKMIFLCNNMLAGLYPMELLCMCIYIWVLIKIKVSGAAIIADQPRINRDPNGVNRGRVLSYATLFCAENRQNIATYHSI